MMETHFNKTQPRPVYPLQYLCTYSCALIWEEMWDYQNKTSCPGNLKVLYCEKMKIGEYFSLQIVSYMFSLHKQPAYGIKFELGLGLRQIKYDTNMVTIRQLRGQLVKWGRDVAPGIGATYHQSNHLLRLSMTDWWLSDSGQSAEGCDSGEDRKQQAETGGRQRVAEGEMEEHKSRRLPVWIVLLSDLRIDIDIIDTDKPISMSYVLLISS